MRLLLAAVLTTFPLQAAEPERHDVYCDGTWCAIQMVALKKILDSNEKYQAKVRELEGLCGWPK